MSADPRRLASPIELLRARADASPAKPFLLFEATEDRWERWTYEGAVDYARRGARLLADLGVGRGDVFALLLSNCPEFLWLWFGAAHLGAVFVPINPLQRGEGLAYVLEHSGAKAVLADDPLLAEALEPLPRRVRKDRTILGKSEAARLMAGAASAPPEAGNAPGDPLGILYTSGTTGRPKGVVLPHYSYLNTGAEFAHHLGLGPEDVCFTPLPLFHCNAQQLTVMGSLAAGGSVALAPRFSASRFWREAAACGATEANFIGSILYALLKQPPAEADRAHQVRWMWGAPAPVEIFDEVERRFGVRLVEAYGLTETATICLANPAQAPVPGSCGRPLGYTEVRVVGDDDVPLPPGRPGEIIARAKTPHAFMKGYYKDPEKTAEAMRGGWFHSGDRGRMDEGGNVYFMDRLKDCIRRRGENISSFEIERVINEHPKVLESAAVGVPSEMSEEEVKVCIVPRPGERLTPEDLVGWCEGKMAPFMIPRYVEIREALPKTPTQRVQKYELRREGVGRAWDRERARPTPR